MRIAYVTNYDIHNVRKVSLAGYYIAKSLQRQSAQLAFVNVLHSPPLFVLKTALKAKELLYRRGLRLNYQNDRSPLLLRQYAGYVGRRVAEVNADVVFSPICTGSWPTSYLRTNRPIVHWTDHTFAGLLDFYPGFTRLSRGTIRDGMRNEQAAFDRAALLIFSSDWAAQTALDNYRVRPEKVRVVPFGPYIDGERAPDEARTIINARPDDRCRLLFLGRDWQRKGGDVALETARILNQRGLPTELTVIGCEPPVEGPLPPFVRSLGFVGKGSDEGRRTIDRALAESHFLILPTRADCAPAAFREAASFALPCLTTRIGGNQTLVRDGLNGQTFPLDAPPAAYAEHVHALITDYRRYRALAQSSFREYEQRLNWNTAGAAVYGMLQELVEQRRPAALAPAI